MSMRTLPSLAFALGLTGAAAPLHAEAYLTPSIGLAFGGDTDDSKLTYAGALTFAGQGGVLGFAVDFAHVPDFLGTTGLGNNNVTSLMGNLVLLTPGEPPGRARLYVSGGAGLMKTRVEDASGFFEVDSNDFGVNAGGGLFLRADAPLGLQVDLRYFRNLTDPEPDAEFDVELGDLDFWRATAGLAIRF